MATVSFLWHLHQPAYRTADGTSHAPWAAVHAGGAYTTLARAIETTGATGHVINIVPTLLEQLLAYAGQSVNDPVVEAMLTPTTDLSGEQQARGFTLEKLFQTADELGLRYVGYSEHWHSRTSVDLFRRIREELGRLQPRYQVEVFLSAEINVLNSRRFVEIAETLRIRR